MQQLYTVRLARAPYDILVHLFSNMQLHPSLKTGYIAYLRFLTRRTALPLHVPHRKTSVNVCKFLCTAAVFRDTPSFTYFVKQVYNRYQSIIGRLRYEVAMNHSVCVFVCVCVCARVRAHVRTWSFHNTRTGFLQSKCAKLRN